MNVQTAKVDLAQRTRRGVHTIAAGVLLWTAFGVLGLVLPDGPQKALIYLFGVGLLWPLGLLVGSILRFDTFARDNPLAMLTGMLGGLQILFAPLMIGAYFATPQMVPWYLGVLVGAHLLPFAWVYDSRAYLFCAVVMAGVAGLTGWLAPAATFVVTPFAIVAVFLITVGLLLREISVDASPATPS